MIKNYYQYINEARQRGPLYHILSVDSLKYVINNNAISGHHYINTISTTRNKMMNFYTGDRPGAFFKLELDGDKLSNDYKIRPYVFVSGGTNVRLDEWEEQVKTKEIKNASKYITKVIIIKNKMDKALKGWDFLDIEEQKPGYWFTSDAKGDMKMQSFLKWLKDNSPAPIYIQDGSKVYQDDEYINSLINEPVYKIDYGYAFYYRGRTEMINNDIFTQKDALFPTNHKNKDIISPVVGYKYEDLYLLSEDEAYSKLEQTEDFIIYKKRKSLSGREFKEKYELYFCKFQLFKQEELPENGFVKSAKLNDMLPADSFTYKQTNKKVA